MAPVALTAVLTPKSPEKAAKFLEKFQECVDWVQKNERDFVYRYELHRGIKEQNGKEQFVVLEQYKDQASMDKHIAAPPIAAMIQTLEKEDLVDTQIIMTNKGPGITPKL